VSVFPPALRVGIVGPRLNELRYGDGQDEPGLYGMRRIRAEHPTHPCASQWWPIGQGIGYGASFANQVADLLQGWPDEPGPARAPRTCSGRPARRRSTVVLVVHRGGVEQVTHVWAS
jgi:hypothetical protein